MKNLKLFILLATISVMSFSCGNDDDNQDSNDNTDNVLVFGDTEIELRAGVIADFGESSDGIFNFDITLVDSQLSQFGGQVFPTNETFSGIYFQLFTDNGEDLDVGVYTFGSVDANAYEFANIFIDASIEDEDADVFEINSGSFTVLDNGSTYEFEFEGTTQDGTEFSGHFRGTLEAVDFSDDNDNLNRLTDSNSRFKRRLFK